MGTAVGVAVRGRGRLVAARARVSRAQSVAAASFLGNAEAHTQQSTLGMYDTHAAARPGRYNGDAGGGTSVDSRAITAMATATRPEAATFHHNWGLGLKNNFFKTSDFYVF